MERGWQKAKEAMRTREEAGPGSRIWATLGSRLLVWASVWGVKISNSHVAGTPYPSQAVTRGWRYPLAPSTFSLLDEGKWESQESDLWPWLVKGLPNVLVKMSAAILSMGNIFLSQPLACVYPRREGAKGSWVRPESLLRAVMEAGNSRIDDHEPHRAQQTRGISRSQTRCLLSMGNGWGDHEDAIDPSSRLFHLHCVPGVVLSTSYVVGHLILMTL